MQIFRKTICCLLVCFFTVVGVSCNKNDTRYEIVMEVVTNDEIISVHQEDPVLDMDIGTAPFQRGYFGVTVRFQVMELKENSQRQIKEWQPLKKWGRFFPSELYGSKVDFCSYMIYDENGEEKQLAGNENNNADLFRSRYNDINFPNIFYLCNTSGLHELTYKVRELKEYNIPETTFKIKLYAKEDERKDGVKIIAQEDPNITKIDGGEKGEDIYLVSKGAKFPKFRICSKDTDEDLEEEYDYYFRKFEPDYERHEVGFKPFYPDGKINLAYIQFAGNELYQPKSYFFYVIYLY